MIPARRFELGRREKMEKELEGISRISDVGYLLTRLRVAKRKNETKIKEAIVQRMKDIGVLKDEEGVKGTPHENLRVYVNKILGTHER
jgi:GTP cyclohydrolase I